MNEEPQLDDTVNKAAYWSAITLFVMVVPSIFLPLDAPEGPFTDRMLWFSSNLGAFIMGWIVQMVAMLTLTAVFAATAWQVRGSRPLSAVIAGIAVLISLVAFIIPKFIAIWSIPQMVAASTSLSANVDVAEQLFQLLNPSLSFSLFTSFDYLGFWMYGVFGLVIAPALFRLSVSAKIAAVALGIFGILFHLLFIAVLTGNIVSADIGVVFESIGALLLVSVGGMAVFFRKAIKAANSEEFASR